MIKLRGPLGGLLTATRKSENRRLAGCLFPPIIRQMCLVYVPFRKCCMDKDRCTCRGVSLDPLRGDIRLEKRCIQQHHNLQLTKFTSEIVVSCSMSRELEFTSRERMQL